ncbi:cell division protein FtsB [Thaumasiovibrio subtropicus]|uniref:cell division protein FtsB n=1 Tax=Thaumasiovibrio subtropicus TaxID=1891207 RepID=UPI000B35B740|nr:cell division protein FtsB [Thaumasiovibrio subtropicus]
MRLLTLSLLIVLAGLQWTLWYGKNGLFDYFEIRDYVIAQQETNHELSLRNEQMYAEIADLNRGVDAIEERARNELGMIKKGETFFRIIDTDQ